MQAYAGPKPKNGAETRTGRFSINSNRAAYFPHCASTATFGPISQLQAMLNKSPGPMQVKRLQQLANRSPRGQGLELQAHISPGGSGHAAPGFIQRECGKQVNDGIGAEYFFGAMLPVQRLCSACQKEEETLQGKLPPAHAEMTKDGPIQGKLIASAANPVQLHASNNAGASHAGLPDRLRSGIESLSGISMGGVRVHYNSSRPAQLNALAYAQGGDIHLAPGQERHLPHEAWHIVQQAQGRVRPTMQLRDAVPINDDLRLEHEADVMGAKAMQMKRSEESTPLDALDGMALNGAAGVMARTGREPMQRRLVIDQSWVEGWYRTNNQFRSQVLAALNSLLHGSGVTAYLAGGVVGLRGEPQHQNDPRYMLLKSVIDAPRDVIVRRTTGHADTDIDRSANVSERTQAAASGTGTNAIVTFDPSHTDIVPTVEGPQKMPAWLILGHELIHGSRIQRGRAAIDPHTGEHQIGVYGNLVTNRPEIGKIEEMLTVGLTPYSNEQIDRALADKGALSAFQKSDKAQRLLKGIEDLAAEPVTENRLRHVHNMPLRSGYETIRQQVLTVRALKVSPLSAFDKLERRRGPTAGQLAIFGAAGLTLFMAWYFRDYLPGLFRGQATGSSS